MVDLDRFRHCTRWHDHANRRRYAAPADPWRLVPVDPAGVDRFAVVDLRYGLGQVRGGDWDTPAECRRLADSRTYEGLLQRFDEGRPWEDTAYHEWVRERFGSEGGFRGLQDFAEHDSDWFEHVDELYESVDDGYRTNRGELYDDPTDLEYVHETDPVAPVGRDGDVVWTEGFHRLTLARVAGVERVPALITWRHEAWQATRDAVAEAVADDAEEPTDGLDASADHPDLRDVLG
ncbi:hypothetical protein BRD13_07490 [Halobacteriales archaeon SW_5_70_135]|nr:MAG: hypothetical protein BRD13_07490 [Halobacteriales archaeon SW_5_70_135]